MFFQGDRFPSVVSEMTQMTWLKLNHASLERVIHFLLVINKTFIKEPT